MLDKFIDLTKPFQKFLEYPKEYNPKVHGPYNPAKFYGKADVPLSQVKIEDLSKWFGRRSFTLESIGRAINRSAWRYRMKYMMPSRISAAFLYHVMFFSFAYHYVVYEYPVRKHHTWAIYH